MHEKTRANEIMVKPRETEHAQGLSKQRSLDTSRSKDSGIDADFPVCLLKTSEVRRDSSGSNDSGCKKQASLDEIQDLYSALQDLVKTNVSATPLSLKNQNFLMSTPVETHSSPRGSPKIENLRVDESATILIDVKKSKITPAGVKNSKHKRVASTGNLESITQKLRKSPFPNRRLSHDVETTNSDKENNNDKSERRNSRSMPSSSNDKSKSGRRDSGSESKPQKKSWKPKLFSRLRSKSSQGNVEDDLNETCYSEGDGGDTPPLSTCDRNRRSSEADMINKIHVSRKVNASNKQRSCPPVRKKRTEEKQSLSMIFSNDVKEIDQLVAALNLEYGDDKSLTVPSKTDTFYKSPESELSKLESWFEKAAAEAVLHQSRMNLDEDSEKEIDELDTKKSKSDAEIKTKRKNGTKRPTTVRRGNSQGRSRDERKYARRSGSNLLGESEQIRLNVHALGTMHARSTPNLRDCELDYETEISQNKSPGESRRYIYLDEPVSRLPKSPLFYVPDNRQSNVEDLKILKQRRLMDSELFYTNLSVCNGAVQNLKNSTLSQQTNNNNVDAIEFSETINREAIESYE